MKLKVVDTGFFKLDGGAMFGVVPKVLWSKKYESDQNNLCSWAARCLLIEDGDRLILVDTGLGNKQSEKFFSYYFLHGDASLESSIRLAGYAPEEVTDVVLTHLHFDHVGGAVSHNKDRTKHVLTFPNARYWSNEAHWQWAIHPNPREKPSFLKENLLPIQESGHLNFIEAGTSPFEHISFIQVNGHTEQMQLPLITIESQKVLFAADLIPSSVHLPLSWVMGYDVRPLISMEEKGHILQRAAKENWILMFEHDAVTEAALVEETERGVQIKCGGKLEDFL